MDLQKHITNITLLMVNNLFIKLLIFVCIQASTFFVYLSYVSTQIQHHNDDMEYKLIQKNRVTTEFITNIFDTVDSELDLMVIDIAKTQKSWWGKLEWHNYLKESTGRIASVLEYVSVYSQKGITVGSSISSSSKIVDISDRVYFRNALAGKYKSYYGPFLGRLSDIWTYASIRRLSLTDGTFDGVLLGAVSLTALSNVCRDATQDIGIQTFILNSENKIIVQCSYNKVIISKTDADFFSSILNTTDIHSKVSTYPNRFETSDNIFLSSELTNGSGVKIITLIPKQEIYTSAKYAHIESSLTLSFLFISNLGLFSLYLTSLLQRIDRRKGNSKIKVIQSSDYRRDDIIIKLPEDGTLD